MYQSGDCCVTHSFWKLAFFFIVIAILIPFRRPTVKGHRSIYTKVSYPCQVRFRRGNVTKIELVLSPLPGTGPCFAISDVSSCPNGLMPRKIEDPRLRKPDISASSLGDSSLTLYLLQYWGVFMNSSRQLACMIENSRYISQDFRNKIAKILTFLKY